MTDLLRLRAAIAALRQLGDDLNRGAVIPNLAEQIWDQCDALSGAAADPVQRMSIPPLVCERCGHSIEGPSVTMPIASSMLGEIGKCPKCGGQMWQTFTASALLSVEAETCV